MSNNLKKKFFNIKYIYKNETNLRLYFSNLSIKSFEEIYLIKKKTNICKKKIESNWRNLRNIASFQNWTTHDRNWTNPNSNIGKLKHITISPKDKVTWF